MIRSLLVSAALILALCPPVPAEEPSIPISGKIEGLRKAVEHVRSSDGDVTVHPAASSAEGSSQDAAPTTISREQALCSLYTDLAALEYHEALETGLPDHDAAAAKSSLAALEAKTAAARDADMVAIDSAGLTESSCYTCNCVTLFGRRITCSRCCTAVMAVRGGRTIDRSVDKELNRLEGMLARVSMETGSKAGLGTSHLANARVYEQLAAASLRKAPAPPERSPEEREQDLNLLAELFLQHMDEAGYAALLKGPNAAKLEPTRLSMAAWCYDELAALRYDKALKLELKSGRRRRAEKALSRLRPGRGSGPVKETSALLASAKGNKRVPEDRELSVLGAELEKNAKRLSKVSTDRERAAYNFEAGLLYERLALVVRSLEKRSR